MVVSQRLDAAGCTQMVYTVTSPASSLQGADGRALLLRSRRERGWQGSPQGQAVDVHCYIASEQLAGGGRALLLRSRRDGGGREHALGKQDQSR